MEEMMQINNHCSCSVNPWHFWSNKLHLQDMNTHWSTFQSTKKKLMGFLFFFFFFCIVVILFHVNVCYSPHLPSQDSSVLVQLITYSLRTTFEVQLCILYCISIINQFAHISKPSIIILCWKQICSHPFSPENKAFYNVCFLKLWCFYI